MKNLTGQQKEISVRNQTSGQTKKSRKFWEISWSFYAKPPGVKILNEDMLMSVAGRIVLGPPFGRRGFPEYLELPTVLIDKRLGRLPGDVEPCSEYWLISDKAKMTFESLDPEAFAFYKCKVELPNGTEGPQYWLCDVVRMLDAVDENKSVMTIKVGDDGRKWYEWIGIYDIVIRPEMVSNARIFRLLHSVPTVVCDESFKLACRDVKRVRFYSLKSQ